MGSTTGRHYKKDSSSSGSKNVFLWIVFIICLVVFLFSGYKLFTIFKGYSDAADYYDDIRSYSPFIGNADTDDDGTDEIASGTALDIDSESLLAINSEFIGWLHARNTKIDYPVAAHNDNDFYLTHDFNKNPLSSGCIFMDCRCSRDLSDFRTIIYGHHMRDGSMFGTLEKFKDESFFKDHRSILFVDRNGIAHRLRIYSAHTTPSDSYVYSLNYKNDKERKSFIRKTVSNSIYKTGITPATEDHIITLSTCAYEYEGARFVVHTVLE